jgi:hypothetical protein
MLGLRRTQSSEGNNKDVLSIQKVVDATPAVDYEEQRDKEEADWIFDHYDADDSGTIGMDELQRLLEEAEVAGAAEQATQVLLAQKAGEATNLDGLRGRTTTVSAPEIERDAFARWWVDWKRQAGEAETLMRKMSDEGLEEAISPAPRQAPPEETGPGWSRWPCPFARISACCYGCPGASAEPRIGGDSAAC